MRPCNTFFFKIVTIMIIDLLDAAETLKIFITHMQTTHARTHAHSRTHTHTGDNSKHQGSAA